MSDVAFAGVAMPVRVVAYNPDGTVADLAALGAGSLRIRAVKEYDDTTALDATSVGFVTDGTDGTFQGIITFTEAGEWEIYGFITVGGTEYPLQPWTLFVQPMVP